MTTPDELRADMAKARSEFIAALQEAGPRWERKPATGDGEDAWSSRQVAEHVTRADVRFASQVCIACGYPGLDPFEPTFPSAADALFGFAEGSALSDGRLKYVSENDLTFPHERHGNVEGLIRHATNHLREHAAQIRVASQGS